MYDNLYHHGIIGQKWGVRRFQDYDGKYTQRGLARYRKSEESYNYAKEKYRESKEKRKSGSGTKSDVQNAKREYKNAKRQMNKDYKNLKYDKLADEGKEKYSQGKRINVNQGRRQAVTTAATVGAALVSSLAAAKLLPGKTISTKYGDIPLTAVAPAVITAGGAAVSTALLVKNAGTDKRLRAYYGHK